jgi:FkbM family methyltransferase
MRYCKKVALAVIVFVFQFCPHSWVKHIIRVCPRLCQGVPSGIAIELNDYLGEFKVSLNTSSVVERYMATGAYERYLSRVLTQRISPGDCCMDVGANVGAICLALAQRATPNGKVIAFEPGPKYYERLLRNISLNPRYIDCIVAENLGVSDRTGFLQWAEDDRPRARGNAGIVSSGGITVPVVALDDYIEKHSISKVHFIKIDTEGWEYHVLMGARKALAAQRPTILFETVEEFNVSSGNQLFPSLTRLFAELKYELYGISYSGDIIRISTIGKYDSTLACPMERGI